MLHKSNKRVSGSNDTGGYNPSDIVSFINEQFLDYPLYEKSYHG